MNKTEYIIRQLAKTNKKNYENYVVTRIWHLLNNLDIKFVTQQHVTRPNGRALTDMYFPQIKLHIEINELHHKKQVNQDAAREADIINATGHGFETIEVCDKTNYDKTIEDINKRIDEVVVIINNKFVPEKSLPWDIEAEYNPQTYIDKGLISVDDNVAFRTIADACNCFGRSYKLCMRGFYKHAIEERMLWFPKLYKNEGWLNEISPDENEISEKQIKKTKKHKNYSEYFKWAKSKPDQLKERVTFAHATSNLGETMYRFKGVYKLDLAKSEASGKSVYIRTDKSVKTYSPLIK